MNIFLNHKISEYNFTRSVKYGLGVVVTSLQYRLHKWGILRSRIFSSRKRLLKSYEIPRVISL